MHESGGRKNNQKEMYFRKLAEYYIKRKMAKREKQAEQILRHILTRGVIERRKGVVNKKIYGKARARRRTAK